MAFYSAKDIPGDNAFAGPILIFFEEDEELFVGDRVKFHGQPAGVIVAESYELAHRAAKLVIVEYARTANGALFTNMADVLVSEEARKARIERKELQSCEANFEGKYFCILILL